MSQTKARKTFYTIKNNNMKAKDTTWKNIFKEECTLNNNILLYKPFVFDNFTHENVTISIDIYKNIYNNKIITL